jgi:hypothetical protein
MRRAGSARTPQPHANRQQAAVRIRGWIIPRSDGARQPLAGISQQARMPQMAVYWITFRISENTVNGRSYEDRYRALQEAVTRRATQFWDQPTSFLVFSSLAEIGTLASEFKRAIAPSHDLFLIREMDTKSAILCGNNQDRDIFGMMPYLKTM